MLREPETHKEAPMQFQSITAVMITYWEWVLTRRALVPVRPWFGAHHNFTCCALLFRLDPGVWCTLVMDRFQSHAFCPIMYPFILV